MKSATALMLALMLVLAGCDGQLDTTYGAEKPGSVDGASVLLARLGQRTRLRRASLLSPRLQDGCDLIVHLADEAALPSAEACTWLRDWLEAEDGRQVVLILRGDSPAPQLCQRWAGEARSEGARVGGALGEGLLALAGRFERAAAQTAAPEWSGTKVECPLFSLRPQPGQPAASMTLEGAAPLLAPTTLRVGPRVEAEDVETQLAARLPGGGTVPWSVTIPVGESRLVVAVNASPLLDGALPDPRARRLMALWLDELLAWHGDDEPPATAWVGALRVRDGEPEAANPMAVAFARWPLALASWHLLALVALWLAGRAWWLGRRETPRDGRTASFGAHVDALAGQLAAEKHHQAAARAIARASGLPVPPQLRDADAARTWLGERASENPEEHR